MRSMYEMNAPLKEPADTQVWVVFVRPIGFPNRPWQEHKVAAQSASQANSRIRSVGYEMQTGTAYISPENSSVITPIDPPLLKCSQCDYPLDGLTVKDASVTCPECAFNQVLIAWSPNLDFQHEGNSALTTGLAIVGAIAMTFIGLIFLFAIFSMF